MLSYILASALSFAADCDVPALKKKVVSDSPDNAASAYTMLSGCDAKAAAGLTSKLYKNLLPSTNGYTAMVRSIELGKSSYAVKWVQSLQSDGRAGAIGALSKACSGSDNIQAFFVAQAGSLGEEFWDQRWYRSLDDCASDQINDLLGARLEGGLDIGRSQYLGILEVYARSAEAEALGPIGRALTEGIKNSDEELQINAIMAFSDAARVSGTEVGNQKVADKAIKRISEKSAELAPKAIQQARLTLQSLGSEEAADNLVQYAYADVTQEDGSLLWGVVAVENAKCRRDKEKQLIHTGLIVDSAKRTWPDQLKPAARASAKTAWDGFKLAETCKGSGSVKIFVPEAPFADKSAYETWKEAIVADNKRSDLKKVLVITEEDVLFQ